MDLGNWLDEDYRIEDGEQDRMIDPVSPDRLDELDGK